MVEKRKKVAEATQLTDNTNVHNPKDLIKVYEYFRYKVGTTLDCARETGVLRNCVTWYVRDLERARLLQAIFRAKDKTTSFMAKHYSADPRKWAKDRFCQLSLFGEE